jgi:hypothetical protein
LFFFGSCQYALYTAINSVDIIGPNEQQPEEEVQIRELVRVPKFGDVSLEAAYFKFEDFVTPQSSTFLII